MKYSVLHTVLDNYSSDLVIAQGFKNFENTKIKKKKKNSSNLAQGTCSLENGCETLTLLNQ